MKANGTHSAGARKPAGKRKSVEGKMKANGTHSARAKKPAGKRKSVAAKGLPDVNEKIMRRSHQRGGMVAGGTLLSSGARQATVTFTPPTFRKLKLAADKNEVSLSEMVRQAVEAEPRLRRKRRRLSNRRSIGTIRTRKGNPLVSLPR